MNIRSLYETLDVIKPITNKCIVLDIDQTLVSTRDYGIGIFSDERLNDPKFASAKKRIYVIYESSGKPFWGICRPYIYEFINFCFSYFKIIAIWSAGHEHYVRSVVKFIFRNFPEPHIIFTNNQTERDNKGNAIKRLNKMINSNLILRRYMSLKNTFVVDDNQNTFQYNKENAIHIPPYEPSNEEIFEDSDDSLLKLMYWLSRPEVKNSEDITLLDKTNIFTTPIETYIQESVLVK